MSNKFCSLRRFFLCLVAIQGLQAAASTSFAATVCARTPAAAIQSDGTGSLSLPLSEGKGYRVASVRWDPVLQQNWATIVSCGHPEWPGFSLRVGEANHAPRGLGAPVPQEHSPAALLVHAGDIVQLWQQEDELRIEVAGVAEESGSLGKTIRVRLLHRNDGNQAAEEQFAGIVRGRSDVEIQP